MSNDTPPPLRQSDRLTAVTCAFLLLMFAMMSYSAVLTKNATIDEPTQAMSGWLELCRGDFRLETVSPPAWQMWAALGNLFSEPKLSHTSPIWNDVTWDPSAEVAWSSQALFDTPGFDGDAFINRSRAMMSVVGLALGAVIAIWSYQLAGPVAAIAATTLYCFDPNFLGHAPLIKSDVALALVLLTLGFVVWRFGQNATIGRLLSIGLVCGAAINVKFSGVIVGPLVAAMLLIRAVLPDSWQFLGHSLPSRLHRFLAAVATGIFAAVCCFMITWASYGFRYQVARRSAVQMNMTAIYARARLVETTIELNRKPTSAELGAHIPSSTARFIKWADNKHLLPQAMLAGLLYQHTCVQLWPAFLDGELYGDGRWRYFPLATIYKTPLATLIAYAASIGIGLFFWVRRSALQINALRKAGQPIHTWTAACLAVPFTGFAFAALTSHLNIGLRNALPVFPYIQIGVGCATAAAWRWRSGFTRLVFAVLALALMGESVHAWPNYIAFFNISVGGPRGGLAHLADSNLDWGQDVQALAEWQRSHPNVLLYAKLYESVDPHFYGVNYRPIWIISEGLHAGELRSEEPMSEGVIAVSATHLQQLYIKSFEMPFYQALLRQRPIAILGGTIYLYSYSPARYPA